MVESGSQDLSTVAKDAAESRRGSVGTPRRRPACAICCEPLSVTVPPAGSCEPLCLS